MRYYCNKCQEWVRFSDEYKHEYKHRKDVYKTGRWSSLRKKVLNRDGFKCVACGAKNVILHIHHVSTRKNMPELEYVVDNCETLCTPCHIKLHPGMEINGL